MNPLRILWVAAISFLISACATTQGPPPLEPSAARAQWEITKEQLRTVSSWRLRGKMGVKTGRKGGSATLKWDYSDQVQRIELYGPFGGGRVIINTDIDGAVLRDTKGKSIVGNSASEVLYQRLGWQVPFNQMADWARGLPGKSATDLKLDGQGRLKELKQDNWLVQYQNYKPFNTGTLLVDLPTRLEISALPGTIEIYSDDGKYIGDDLSVKVLLKKWWEIEIDPT